MSANLGRADALLDVESVAATYGGAVEALRHVSFRIAQGEALAVVGANGAGKTTLARAISNLLPAERGRVIRGSLRFDGRDILSQTPGDLVRQGLVPVLEGRRCFAAMTVEENLVTGAIARGSSRQRTRVDLSDIYDVFPRLAAKRRVISGQISGGEQQMTAIGRALMTGPRLLVLDEPSMGLAPLTTTDIFESLLKLKRERSLTIVFCEQNARLAKRYADRIIALTSGASMAAEGLDSSALAAVYFGNRVEPVHSGIPEPTSAT